MCVCKAASFVVTGRQGGLEELSPITASITIHHLVCALTSPGSNSISWLHQGIVGTGSMDSPVT